MDDSTKTQISKLLHREKILLGEVPPTHAQSHVTSQIPIKKISSNDVPLPAATNTNDDRNKSRSLSFKDPEFEDDSLQYRKRVARLATSPPRERNIENIAPEPNLTNRQNDFLSSALDSPILQNEDIQNAVRIREREILEKLKNDGENDDIDQNTPSRSKKRILIDAITPTRAKASAPVSRSKLFIRRPFAFVDSRNYHYTSRNLSRRPLLPSKEVQSMLTAIRTPIRNKNNRSRYRSTATISNSNLQNRLNDAMSASAHFSNANLEQNSILQDDSVSAFTTDILSQCMSLLTSAGSLLTQIERQELIQSIRRKLTLLSVEQFRLFSLSDSKMDMRDLEEIGKAGNFSLLDLQSILSLRDFNTETSILGDANKLVLDALDPRMYHLSQLLRLDHSLLLQAGSDENDFEHVLCLLTNQSKVNHSDSFYFAVFIARIPKVHVNFSDLSLELEENEFDETSFHELKTRQLQSFPQIAMICWILNTLFMVLQNNITNILLTEEEKHLKETLYQEKLSALSRDAIDYFKVTLNTLVFPSDLTDRKDDLQLKSPQSKQEIMYAICAQRKEALYQEALSITQCINTFVSYTYEGVAHCTDNSNPAKSGCKNCVSMISVVHEQHSSMVVSSAALWEVNIVTSDKRILAERLSAPSIQRLLQSMHATALSSEVNQQQYYSLMSVQDLGQEEQLWFSRVFGNTQWISENCSLVCTLGPYTADTNNKNTIRFIVFPIHNKHDTHAQKTVYDILNRHLLSMRQGFSNIYGNFEKEQDQQYDIRLNNVQMALINQFLDDSDHALQLNTIVSKLQENEQLSQILQVRKTRVMLSSWWKNKFDHEESEVLYVPKDFSKSDNIWTKRLLAGEMVVLNDFHLIDSDDSVSVFTKESMKQLLKHVNNDNELSMRNVILIPVFSSKADEKQLNLLVLLDNTSLDDLDDTLQFSENHLTVYNFAAKRVQFIKRAILPFIQILSQQLTQAMYVTKLHNNMKLMSQVHHAKINRLKQERETSMTKSLFSKWYITYLRKKQLRLQQDISLACNLLSAQHELFDESDVMTTISTVISSSSNVHHNKIIADEGRKLMENMKSRKVKKCQEMDLFATKLVNIYVSFSSLVTVDSDFSACEVFVKGIINDIVTYRLNSLWPEKVVHVTVESVSFIFKNSRNEKTVNSSLSRYHSDRLLLSFSDHSQLQWQLYQSLNDPQRYILHVSQKACDDNAVSLELFMDKLYYKDIFPIFINIEEEGNSACSLLLSSLLQKIKVLQEHELQLLKLSDELCVADDQYEKSKHDMDILRSQYESTTQLLHELRVEHTYLMNVLRSSLITKSRRFTPIETLREGLSSLSQDIWNCFPQFVESNYKTTYATLFVNAYLFSEQAAKANEDSTSLCFQIVRPPTTVRNADDKQCYEAISQLYLSPPTNLSLSDLQHVPNTNLLLLQDVNHIYGAVLLFHSDNSHTDFQARNLDNEHINVTYTHVLKELYQQFCGATLISQVKKLTMQNNQLTEETQERKNNERLLENTLHDTVQKLSQQLQQERSLLNNQISLLETKLSNIETELRKEIDSEQDTVRSLVGMLQSMVYDSRLYISQGDNSTQMKVMNNLMLDFVHNNHSKDDKQVENNVSIRSKLFHIQRSIEPTLHWLDTQSSSRRSRMSLVSTKTLNTMLHSKNVLLHKSNNYSYLMDTFIERYFPLSTLAQSIPHLFEKIDEAISQGQTLLIDCTLYHNNIPVSPLMTKDESNQQTEVAIAPQLLIIPNRRIQSYGKYTKNCNEEFNVEWYQEGENEEVAAYIFIKDEGYGSFVTSDLAFLEAVCNLASMLMGLPLTLCMFATPLPPLSDARDTEIASLKHQLAHSLPKDEYEKQLKRFNELKCSSECIVRDILSCIHSLVHQKPFQEPAMSLFQVQRLIASLSAKIFTNRFGLDNTQTFMLFSRTRFHAERQFLLRQLSSSIDVNNSDNTSDNHSDLLSETIQLLMGLQQQVGMVPALEAVLAQPHKRHILLSGHLIVYPLPIHNVNEKENTLCGILLFKRGQSEENQEFESRSLLLHCAAILLLERYLTNQASLTAIQHATQALEVVSQSKDALQSLYASEIAKSVTLTRYMQCSLRLHEESLHSFMMNNVNSKSGKEENHVDSYCEKWSFSSDIQRLRRSIQTVLSEVDDVLVFLDPYMTSSESNTLLSTLFPPETVSPSVYEELQRWNNERNQMRTYRLLCISDVGVARFVTISEDTLECTCIRGMEENNNRAYRIVNSESLNLTFCDQFVADNKIDEEAKSFQFNDKQCWSLNQARNALKQLLINSSLSKNEEDMPNLTAGSALIVPCHFYKNIVKGCIVVLKRGDNGFDSVDTHVVHNMCRAYSFSLFSTLLMFDNQDKANHLIEKEGELQIQHCEETKLTRELLDIKDLTSSLQHIASDPMRVLSIGNYFSDNILSIFSNVNDSMHTENNSKAMFTRYLSLFNLEACELSSGALFENTVSTMIENKRRAEVNQSVQSLESINFGNKTMNNSNIHVRMLVISLPTLSAIDKISTLESPTLSSKTIFEIDHNDVALLYSDSEKKISEVWAVVVSEEIFANLYPFSINNERGDDEKLSIPCIPLKHIISSHMNGTNQDTKCLFAFRITCANTNNEYFDHSLFGKVCLSLTLTRMSAAYCSKLLFLSNKVIDEKQHSLHLIQKHYNEETNLTNDIELLTKQHFALKQAENVKNAVAARKRLLKKRIVSVCHTTINRLYNEFHYESFNGRKNFTTCVPDTGFQTVDEFYSLFQQFFTSYNITENNTSKKWLNCDFKDCDFGGFSFVPMKRKESNGNETACWTVSSIVSLPEVEATLAASVTDYLFSQYVNSKLSGKNDQCFVCVMADDTMLVKVNSLISEVNAHNLSVLCAHSLFVTHAMKQNLTSLSIPQVTANDSVYLCVFAPLNNTALLMSVPSLSSYISRPSNISGNVSLLCSNYVMRCFVQTALHLTSLMNYKTLYFKQCCELQQSTHRLFEKHLQICNLVHRLKKKQLKLSFARLFTENLRHNIQSIKQECHIQQQSISKLQKRLMTAQQQLADFAELQAMALSASNSSDNESNDNVRNENINDDSGQEMLRELWGKCSLTLCSLLAGHVSVKGLSLIINPSFIHSIAVGNNSDHVLIMGDEEVIHNAYFHPRSNVTKTYDDFVEEWQAVEAVSPVIRRPNNTDETDHFQYNDMSIASQVPAVTIQRIGVSQLNQETQYIVQKLFGNDPKYTTQKIYRLCDSSNNSGDKNDITLLVSVGHNVTGIINGVLKIHIACPDTMDLNNTMLAVENISLQFSTTLLPLLRHTMRQSVLVSEVKHTTRALTLQLTSERQTAALLHEKQQFVRDLSKDISLLMHCVSHSPAISEIEHEFLLLSNMDQIIHQLDNNERLDNIDNKKETLLALERTTKQLCLGVSQAMDCAVSLLLEPICDKDISLRIWQKEQAFTDTIFSPLVHHREHDSNLVSTQREQQTRKLAELFPYSLSVPLYYDTIHDNMVDKNVYLGEITLRFATPLRRDSFRQNSVLQQYIAYDCVSILCRVMLVVHTEIEQYNKMTLFANLVQKNEHLLKETLRHTESHVSRRTTLLRQVMFMSRNMLLRHSESRRVMMLNHLMCRATLAANQTQISLLSNELANLLSAANITVDGEVVGLNNRWNRDDIVDITLQPTKDAFQKLCYDFMSDRKEDAKTVEKPLLSLRVSLVSDLFDQNETNDSNASCIESPFFYQHSSNHVAHLQHNETLKHMSNQCASTGLASDLRVRYDNDFDILLVSVPLFARTSSDHDKNSHWSEKETSEEESEIEQDAALLQDALIPNTFNTESGGSLEESVATLEGKWLISVEQRLHKTAQDVSVLFDASLQRLLSICQSRQDGEANRKTKKLAVVSLMCLVPVQFSGSMYQISSGKSDEEFVSHFDSLTKCMKRLSSICCDQFPSALGLTSIQLTLKKQLNALSKVLQETTQDNDSIKQNLLVLQNKYEKRVAHISRHLNTRMITQQFMVEHLLRNVDSLMRRKYKYCVKQMLSLHSSRSDNVEREEARILSELSVVTHKDMEELFNLSHYTSNSPIMAIQMFDSHLDANSRIQSLSQEVREGERLFCCVSPVNCGDSPVHFILLAYKQPFSEVEAFENTETNHRDIEQETEMELFVSQMFQNFHRILTLSQERVANSVNHILKIVKHAITHQSENKFSQQLEQVTKEFESKLKQLVDENEGLRQGLRDKSLSLKKIEDDFASSARVVDAQNVVMSRVSPIARSLCDQTELLSRSLVKFLKHNRSISDQWLNMKRSKNLESLRNEHVQSISFKRLKLQQQLDRVENLFFFPNESNRSLVQFSGSSFAETEVRAFQMSLKHRRDYFETQFMHNIATVLLLKIQLIEELSQMDEQQNHVNIEDIEMGVDSEIEDSTITDFDESKALETLKGAQDTITVLRDILSHESNYSTSNTKNREAPSLDICEESTLPQKKLLNRGKTESTTNIAKKPDKEMNPVISKQADESDNSCTVYISLIRPCELDLTQTKENVQSGVHIDVLTYSVSNVSIRPPSADASLDSPTVDSENERAFYLLQHSLSSTSHYKQSVSRHSNLSLLSHATLARSESKNTNKAKLSLPSMLETQLQLLAAVNSTDNHETVSNNKVNEKRASRVQEEDVTDQLLYNQTSTASKMGSNMSSTSKSKAAHFAFFKNRKSDDRDRNTVGIRDWKHVHLNDCISLPTELTQQLMSLNRDTAPSHNIAEAHLYLFPITLSRIFAENQELSETEKAQNEGKGVVLRILLVRHTKRNATSSPLQPLSASLIDDSCLLKLKTQYLMSLYRDIVPGWRHIQYALQNHTLSTQHAALRHKLSRVLAQQDARLLRIQQSLEKFSVDTVRYLLSNYNDNNNSTKMLRHHPATLTPLQATQQRCRLALKMCLKVMRCSAAALLIPSYKNSVEDNDVKSNMSPEKLKVMVFGDKSALSFPSQSISSNASSEFFTIIKPSESTTPVSLQMSWRHSLVVTCLKTGRQIVSRDVLTDKRYMALTDGVVAPGAAMLVSPVYSGIARRGTNSNDDSDLAVRAVLMFVRDAESFQFSSRHSKVKDAVKKIGELNDEGLVDLMEKEQREECGFTKEEVAQASLLCSILSLEMFWCEGLNEVHAMLNRTHQKLEKLEERLIGNQEEKA